MIHGHHPEDAEAETHSSLELNFDLDEEDKLLDKLREITTLRLRLNMRNNSHTPSALSPDQYLSGNLLLEIKDGITIDLSKTEK